MQWNTPLSLAMLPTAKVLARPIVNGYLGIAPPWFAYAGSVLHRFPEPEARWLLMHWNVDTVVSIIGNVDGAESEFVLKGFQDDTGTVYEILGPALEIPHPSTATCVSAGSPIRVGASLLQQGRTDDGAWVTIGVPAGFLAKRVEVDFGPPALAQIPESVDVFSAEGPDRDRLNEGPSGAWLHCWRPTPREPAPAVATISLRGPQESASRS
jgi:hypothetical protein